MSCNSTFFFEVSDLVRLHFARSICPFGHLIGCSELLKNKPARILVFFNRWRPDGLILELAEEHLVFRIFKQMWVVNRLITNVTMTTVSMCFP